MKALFERLNVYLLKFKWYQWCKANDLLSHYYVAEYLLLVVATIRLFMTSNIIMAYVTGLAATSIAMLIKESVDKTGFSTRDLKNGTYGLLAGTFKFILVVVVFFFLKDVVLPLK